MTISMYVTTVYQRYRQTGGHSNTLLRTHVRSAVKRLFQSAELRWSLSASQR